MEGRIERAECHRGGEVVVKGTRGNEGAEKSGVHDEEEWTKDRALGTGRQVSYTFDTEGTR